MSLKTLKPKRSFIAVAQLSIAMISLSLLAMSCIEQSKRTDAQVQVVSSQSSSGNVQINSAGMLAGFQSTVYPYVATNCRSCHGSTQSPKFAQSDVNAAMDVALHFPVVNFSDIPSLYWCIR